MIEKQKLEDLVGAGNVTYAGDIERLFKGHQLRQPNKADLRGQTDNRGSCPAVDSVGE